MKYYSPLIFCRREVLNRFFQSVDKVSSGKMTADEALASFPDIIDDAVVTAAATKTSEK